MLLKMKCVCFVHAPCIMIEMYNNVIHKKNIHHLNDEHKIIYQVLVVWKEVSTFMYKAWTMRTNLLYCTR